MYMIERTVIDFDRTDAKEYWNFATKKWQYYPTGTFSLTEAKKIFDIDRTYDGTVRLIGLEKIELDI